MSVEATANAPARPRTRRARRTYSRTMIWAQRAVVVAVVLALWQFLPEISTLRNFSAVFDPFFVSSPSRVFDRVVDLVTGSNGQDAVWPYLRDTLKGTFLGVAIGTILGAALGLVLSNAPTLQAVLQPFISILNATPRIALIPIFVIIAGPTLTATVLTAVAVVFFLVFYNAYAGGISVPQTTIQNAQLLGASPREVMLRLRARYVMVWTFTSLPNAISFGLVAVVTAELLTGRLGMGTLLLNSVNAVDSTFTFAVVFILSIVGLVLVGLTEFIEKRLLHWWERSI